MGQKGSDAGNDVREREREKETDLSPTKMKTRTDCTIQRPLTPMMERIARDLPR